MTTTLLILLSVLSPTQTTPAASRPATPSRPTLGVLADGAMGLKDSPLVALLETQLAAGGKVTLLERGLIDRVLAEQTLATLLGAEAGGKRVALGKLLKADLLLMLQAREEDRKRYIDITACETKQGLSSPHASRRPVRYNCARRSDLASGRGNGYIAGLRRAGCRNGCRPKQTPRCAYVSPCQIKSAGSSVG